jgi:hypothetical protein
MFDSLVSSIEADLGGRDQLSTIEISLIEGFAGSSVVLNDLNTRLALGQAIDLAEHASVCSSMVRIAAKIGLSRRSRVVNGLVEAVVEVSPASSQFRLEPEEESA